MSVGLPRGAGKYVASVLIALGFCVIIWTSPNAEYSRETLGGRFSGPTLIIDPGHGGEDGGAVSADGLVESGVNLDIALRLRALADFLGIDCVMTREGEAIDYPQSAATTAARKRWDTRQRVELINAVPGGVLISIHQNCYPSKAPRGTQAFYGAGEDSLLLASLLHENLILTLCPENRRVAAPIGEDIYIMSHVECPAVLVECGFLSNPAEAALLDTAAYRQKLALVIAGSFLQYVEAHDETEDELFLHTMR